MKKFLVGLLAVLVFNFAAVAHAEEVDPYFLWEIKNFDAYKQSNLAVYGIDIDRVNTTAHEKARNRLFVYDIDISKIDATRDKLYAMINTGNYSDAATLCEIITAHQKILFGTNYFDASLTELTAKLYLETDNLDAAERKINFLSDNAQDNLTKIRALNLQSDLLNRRGNYAEALQLTDEAATLLKVAPDEKLSLINRARAARALCGLGEMQKSLELAGEIYQSMQATFGKADFETLALMSTVVENCLKMHHYKDGLKFLMDKFQFIRERYGTDNLLTLSKSTMESAQYFFATENTANGEDFSNSVLIFATRYVDKGNYHEALRLYKAINKIVTQNLPADNPVVLKSEFGLANMNHQIGNITQSIAFCEKNLPQFKKVFGRQDDETLTLMKILSDNYLLLGRYDDAKKIADERLNICQKHFGDSDPRTFQSTIDLANICYRTGKYKTADKLLDAMDVPQNRELFKTNPHILHNLWFSKYFGERMKGGNLLEYSDFITASEKLEENGFLNLSDTLDLEIEILEWFSVSGQASDIAYNEIGLMNIAKNLLNEHHPKILEMMNAIAKYHIAYGNLSEAEKFAERIIELSGKHFGKGSLCEYIGLSTLAKIRRVEGDFPAALKLDNQALQIAENVCGKNSLERLQSLDAIADDHAAKGNFNEAIKIREGALAEYRRILEDNDAATVQMMTNLAEDYTAAGRYDDAVKFCDKTLALLKVPVYIGEQIFSYTSVTELIRIKATAQKLSGDAVNAYSNYRKLIQVYEGQRAASVKNFSSPESKSKWFSGIVPVYKDAAAVAASDKVDDTTFAFYCTEFCKGRNLIDRYDDILVARNYLLTAYDKNALNEYEKLFSSCQAVSEYAAAMGDDTLLSNAETIRLSLYFSNDLFKRELREKYSAEVTPKDDKDLSKLNIWTWDSILKNFDVKKNQTEIPNGACLIEFMKVSDDSLLVTFLRNEGDIQAANIPVDAKFFDDCRLYHDSYAYADIETTEEDDAEFDELRQELSAELSAKLMPTFEKFAGNSSRWIISPDAELNLVPFETLTYRGKFLIESTNVSYVPSLAVMNLMREHERKNAYFGQRKELFAMGDAIYSNADAATSRGNQQNFFRKLRDNSGEKIDMTELKWSNLPGTARELDNVSRLFNSKEIFRREQASEKNLRQLNLNGELSNYKYLLFATHGIFIPKKPEYSSIVLSQQFNDAEHDGYITVGEWMGYDLRSDLIYLSACESGLGGEQAGEGIVGIPYALTVAGNKDTVMSLWKVYDTATAEFTSAVFEKLSRGQSEVAALNETKREFLNHNNHVYRNPAVWAAFVLYGI